MNEEQASEIPKDEEPEEDLGDDVIFEPSRDYQGRRAAVAIKDGLQVCWTCFEPLDGEYREAILGDGILRICAKNQSCSRSVGRANLERENKIHDGKLILLHNLSNAEKMKVLAELDAEKKKRGKRAS